MIDTFNTILIDKSASVKDAMKKLDKSAEKILFVTENRIKLIGSLTDGDIRRWILSDGDLNDVVLNVCFKGTFFVNEHFSLSEIKEEIVKREIFYVPVVNERKEILDFLVWDKLFDRKLLRKSKQLLDAEVVIMAGGKGTRLDPFTKILPKPLIPIGEQSILEIIIDRFVDYQVKEFFISVNHKAKIIKSYFEEIQPEYKLTYLFEEKPLGTVGALKQLEGMFRKEIILTNCDIIIDTDYSDLLRHHKEQKNAITIVASLKHYNIPYGICEIENGGQLVNIKEKPEYDFLINTGMYVINPEVISHIPENELFHITHLIDKIKQSHRIGIYPISENSWTDTGEWIEYRKAVEKFKL